MSDPKVREQAAAMMQNPELVKQGLNTLTSSLKDGGGGMAGMLLRNSPVKGIVDKMGGVENLERMMSDPEVMRRVQEMMKDPAMVAKASANMEALMKNEQQLPEKK